MTIYFNPISSLSHDRIPIPIPMVVYKHEPILSRSNILISIPPPPHSRTWYSKFRTSYDYLE